MKITFISFSVLQKGYASALKPLVFPIISALTPEDIEIRFIDERVEDLPETIDSDIIVMTVGTMTSRRARAFALRHKDKIIAVGGPHPTSLPEECLEYADAVFIGDSEGTWQQFIEDAKNGNIKQIYKAPQDVLPIKPDLNLEYFKGKKYSFVGIAQFARGCKYNCEFCFIKVLYPGKVKTKNIDDFVEEVKSMPEKIMFLIDDNLFTDEETTLLLLEKIKPLKKMWHCQVSIDVAQNDKILKAMKDAGFAMIMMGFEATDMDTLKQMNKGANLKLKSYDEAIKNVYKHGLMITAGFVIGYDNDTPQTIRNTFDFAMKHHFTKAFFTMLQPMPGTKLYNRLLEEGRVTPKWWLDSNYQYGDCAFEPKNMTREELSAIFDKQLREYYTFSNIWKRFLKNSQYLPLMRSIMFLVEALLFKKHANLNINLDLE